MKKVAYSGIRGSITQYVRLASRIFHPHLSIEVKAHQLGRYRLQHKDITYTPILLKIIATVAKKYPLMNGIVSRSLLRKKIFVPDEVDISIAMEKNYKGETFVKPLPLKSITYLISHMKNCQISNQFYFSINCRISGNIGH